MVTEARGPAFEVAEYDSTADDSDVSKRPVALGNVIQQPGARRGLGMIRPELAAKWRPKITG